MSGSEVYDIRVRITPLAARKWSAVKRRCAGEIGSLLELLRGDLSDQVMQVVTDQHNGLFPRPSEIAFDCDCPDWADMCKHVAAVLYGVGARLDESPELLFHLRGIDHEELIDADAAITLPAAARRSSSRRLKTANLADVFGIELEAVDATGAAGRTAKPNGKAMTKGTSRSTNSRAVSRKPASQKPAKKAAKKRTAKKVTAKKASRTTSKRAVAGKRGSRR